MLGDVLALICPYSILIKKEMPIFLSIMTFQKVSKSEFKKQNKFK